MLPLVEPPDLAHVALSNSFSGATLGDAACHEHAVRGPEEDPYFRAARCTPLEDATTVNAIPSPPPAPSELAEPTPFQEHPPDLAAVEFERNIGLTGVPTQIAPSIPKSMRNLRLPSFDALGIASPHSNNRSDPTIQGVELASTSLAGRTDDLLLTQNSNLASPLATTSPTTLGTSPSINTPAQLKPGHQFVPNFILTQTPPDDAGRLEWNALEAKTAATTEQDTTESSNRESVLPAGVDSLTSTGSSSGMAGHVPFAPGSGRAPWLRDALGIILDIVHQHHGSDAIKILSHALPSPSVNGHAFPLVIETIQQSTSSNSIMWLSVWHAVSGRFNFGDLPKSPPTTPAPPFEGDDYFTQRVFDYAVEVPDYQQRTTVQPMSPRQQRPAIAPSSIDISIVERYIPPTSSAEFEELFSVTGRSFLSDRIIELSPSHGTLLFIYPTRSGGTTFKRHYLEPVLDPTLRSMMISQGLPVTLVEDIGRMAAIQQLPTFDEMKSQLQTFLNTLNNGGTPSRHFSRHRTTHTLMYAKAQDVHLDRDVWARDWWNKQEKLRIQKSFESNDVQGATMDRQAGAFQASAHLATATQETHQAAQSGQSHLIQRAQTQSLLRDAERTRGERQPGHNEELILRLLQQVATKEYRDGPPTAGIEVGVFVIQKTVRTDMFT